MVSMFWSSWKASPGLERKHSKRLFFLPHSLHHVTGQLDIFIAYENYVGKLPVLQTFRIQDICVHIYICTMESLGNYLIFQVFFTSATCTAKMQDRGCGSAAIRTVPQGQSDVTLKCFLNLYLPRNGKLFVFILPQPTCGTEVAHMKGLESLL